MVSGFLKDFLHGVDLKKGYSWEEKYKGTLDLRPSVFGYDTCFVDFLFENNFHDDIRDLIGHDLVLSHVQIRKSNSKESYMPWHRDNYFISGREVGSIPPSHKIIYYPSFDGLEEPRLEVLAGSHLNWFPNQKENEFLMPGFSIYDRELFRVLMMQSIDCQQGKALFFNTSLMHNVVGDKNGGSIRLIFSFVEHYQFTEAMMNKEIHTDLRKIYLDKLAAFRQPSPEGT
tara:strand:- start:82 stop:768 length:687 start_codon:yes stop_codon:yes gene_type:complete